MIKNEHLLKALRKKDFSFKCQSKNIDQYKQKGGTNRVQIGRRKLHDNIAAKMILRSAGYTPSEIESLIVEFSVD